MMNSLNDKIPVKNFNDFFENDQTSRAFSRLAERKLKKFEKIQPKFYKYNRDELLALSQHPTSKMTKTEFLARLKNPELDEEIILSFQKKERHNIDLIELLMDNNRSSTTTTATTKSGNGNDVGGGSLSGNSGGSGRSSSYNNNNSNNSENTTKIYRFNKYQQPSSTSELSSGGDRDRGQPSWRTERYSPNFRGKINRHQDNHNHHSQHRSNNGGHGRGGGHRNYRYDNGRDSYNSYNSNKEPEPEWFSDGPKSMTDFIDLKGFDDDDNGDDDDDDGGIDYDNNGDEKDDNNDNDEKLVKNQESLSFNMINDDISKDDFSSFLDSSDISLLDNIDNDFAQFFGVNSSRSARWFKSKMANNNDDDISQMERKLSLTAANDSNISLMDLFQKKNIDINQLQKTLPQISPTMNSINLSEAVNVSELEASYSNNGGGGSSSLSTSTSNSSSTQTPKPISNQLTAEDFAIMSKLKFLAAPQAPPPSQTSPSNLMMLMNNNDNDNNDSGDSNLMKKSSMDSTTLQAMFEKSFRCRLSPDNQQQQQQATNIQMNNEISELDPLKRGSLQQQQPPPSSSLITLDGIQYVPAYPNFPSSGPIRPLFPAAAAPGHSVLHPHGSIMPMNAMNQMIPNSGLNRMQQFPPYSQSQQSPFMMGGGFPRTMLMRPPLRPVKVPLGIPVSGAAEKQFINFNHHAHQPPLPPPHHPHLIPSNIIHQHQHQHLPIIPTSNIRNNNNQSLMNLQQIFNESNRFESNPNEDNNNSMANKLLKNSKFTPTSVFRKLKDHDNQNQVNKQQKTLADLSKKMSTSSDSIEQQQQQQFSAAVNNSDNSPKNLSEMTNLLMQQLNISPNQPTKQSSEMSKTKSSSSTTTSVNPNDIFNVFKMASTSSILDDNINNDRHQQHCMNIIGQSNSNITINTGGDGGGGNNNGGHHRLPPLPLQNALTVEDLEKL